MIRESGLRDTVYRITFIIFQLPLCLQSKRNQKLRTAVLGSTSLIARERVNR